MSRKEKGEVCQCTTHLRRHRARGHIRFRPDPCGGGVRRARPADRRGPHGPVQPLGPDVVRSGGRATARRGIPGCAARRPGPPVRRGRRGAHRTPPARPPRAPPRELAAVLGADGGVKDVARALERGAREAEAEAGKGKDKYKWWLADAAARAVAGLAGGNEANRARFVGGDSDAVACPRWVAEAGRGSGRAASALRARRELQRRSEAVKQRVAVGGFLETVLRAVAAGSAHRWPHGDGPGGGDGVGAKQGGTLGGAHKGRCTRGQQGSREGGGGRRRRGRSAAAGSAGPRRGRPRSARPRGRPGELCYPDDERGDWVFACGHSGVLGSRLRRLRTTFMEEGMGQVARTISEASETRTRCSFSRTHLCG